MPTTATGARGTQAASGSGGGKPAPLPSGRTQFRCCLPLRTVRLCSLKEQCATPTRNSTTYQRTAQPPHPNICCPSSPHPPRGKSLLRHPPGSSAPSRYCGVPEPLVGQFSLTTLRHRPSLGTALFCFHRSVSNTYPWSSFLPQWRKIHFPLMSS